MEHDIWIYILVTGLVSYLIRVTPLALIRREIRNRLVRSFLYYVPYVTLAVMTFPAWRGRSLFQVAVFCCVTVFALELLLL